VTAVDRYTALSNSILIPKHLSGTPVEKTLL